MCQQKNTHSKRGNMEGYIKRINHKVITKHNKAKQRKIKKKYQLFGGLVLGIGLAGFIAAFVSFMVLFFKFETDAAMIAWVIAVPFILMIVAGSVVARVGDMLLKDFVEKEYQADKKNKKKKKKSASQ